MFAAIDSLVGNPQAQLSGITADSSPRMQPGMILTMTDSWWGTGEFIYARAAGTIRAFGLCALLPVFDSTLQSWRFDVTEVPNTANLGRALCVSQMALTSGQYSWFCLTGLTPVNSNASVAADTSFGIVATGQGGAVAAGKQVLNARVVGAATITVAKGSATAPAGGQVLAVGNSDGWFVGAYLSGTGIAAGTTVTNIDPSGRFVSISAPTTAIVNGTVTATYNNGTVFYNVAHLNRPFAQGAIT